MSEAWPSSPLPSVSVEDLWIYRTEQLRDARRRAERSRTSRSPRSWRRTGRSSRRPAPRSSGRLPRKSSKSPRTRRAPVLLPRARAPRRPRALSPPPQHPELLGPAVHRPSTGEHWAAARTATPPTAKLLLPRGASIGLDVGIPERSCTTLASAACSPDSAVALPTWRGPASPPAGALAACVLAAVATTLLPPFCRPRPGGRGARRHRGPPGGHRAAARAPSHRPRRRGARPRGGAGNTP